MSDIPYIHRRCEKCDHIQRTRAAKSWTCKNCHHVNRINRARKLKPPKTQTYMSLGFKAFEINEKTGRE